MKPMFRTLHSLVPIALCLFILADAAFLAHDAQGRAGRGESYRSSDSSSSSSSGSSYRYDYNNDDDDEPWYKRKEDSSPSSDSTSSGSSSSSSSSSSGSGSSTPAPKVVKDYDNYYTFNAWSAVLTVNRDGSVDVTEKFDVTMTEYQYGIIRSLDQGQEHNAQQYNTLLITGATCPQGYAEYKDGKFQFGYKDRKVTGKQAFTLNYRATGMVVPALKGARFQWRPMLLAPVKADSIRVVLPQGTTPLRSRLIEVKSHRYSVYNILQLPAGETELSCAVAGNALTFSYVFSSDKTIDLTVDLPEGVIDTAAALAGLEQALKDKSYPSVQEYRGLISINEDRTVDREESYAIAPGSRADRTIMRYRKRFMTRLVQEKKGPYETPLLVMEDQYLYGFDKGSCNGDDFTPESVCLPTGTGGTTRFAYSMLGNYNPKEPFFFEFRLPSAHVKRIDRTRFEIAFPPFVKKEQVQVRLYLLNGFYDGNNNHEVYRAYDDHAKDETILHEADFDSRWEGNRLVGEYPAGLYDEQFLTMRIFLPAAGFVEPGGLKMMRITLSTYWHFRKTRFMVFAIILACALAAFIVPFIRRKKRAAAEDTSKGKPPAVSIDAKITGEVLAGDPGFSAEAFLERAAAIAAKIQESWSGGSMMPVRNLVSQGVYNRFRIQLKLMREQEQLENLIDGFRATALSLTGSSLSRAYQTLHVRMSASARDITVPVSMSAEDKQRALSKAMPSSFTEIYSFTRKRGAKTDAAKNILAGQCPGCGAVADAAGESNKCASCGTIYNSGEFDWVLSEITQIEEWKPGSAAVVPGLAALENDHLSINREVIEDRASYLFWRWATCMAAGDGRPLLRDATAKFMESFKPAPGYIAEIAVGSVNVQEVAASGGEARATVLVLWSAAFTQGKVPEHREHVLTLTLSLQMKNPYGFADHSCDSCGAPLPESDAAACTYCGAALQKTNSDWLLDGVAEKK